MFAREAYPLIAPLALLGALSWLAAWLLSNAGYFWAGLVLLVLACGILLFFRDPARTVPNDPLAVVSPADGKVIAVDTLSDGRKHISIFLSVFDVHINRVPFGGVVDSVVMEAGSYFHAGSPQAEGNAKCTVVSHSARGTVGWRQVSGLIARKISCRIAAGDGVVTGQRFGLIYFGSRMDVYLPSAVTTLAQPGQRVLAGETILAKFSQ